MTLQPTYRLLWGSAGSSNALDIATALGFDPAVLFEARMLARAELGRQEESLGRMEQVRRPLACMGMSRKVLCILQTLLRCAATACDMYRVLPVLLCSWMLIVPAVLRQMLQQLSCTGRMMVSSVL
jgi:hypothetical protein